MNILSLTGLMRDQIVVGECILLEVLQLKKVVTLKFAIFTGLFTEVVEGGTKLSCSTRS
jgi:hypothetical protein